MKLGLYDVSGLTGLDCLSADVCFGFDGAGQFFRTDNGGVTWAKPSAPPVDFAGRVACASPTVCVAAGRDLANLAMASTHDGGDTWTAQTIASQSYIRAIDCASLLFCVAVGDRIALSSHDGGLTWTNEPSFNFNLYSDVECMNATTCLAVSDNSTVWTQDGGQTWTFAGGSGGSAVGCSSASCAVFVGATAGQAGFAFVWVPPPGTSEGSSIPAGLGPMNQVTCSNASCLAIGSATAAFPALSLSLAAILRSTDGGRSWTRVASPPAAEYLNDLACVSSSTCVVVGSAGTMTAGFGFEGTIRRTVDGGTTWSAVALPTSLGALNFVDCHSDGSCVAAGSSDASFFEPALFAYSSDSGASWSIASPPLTVASVGGLVCATPSACYASASYFDPTVFPNYVGILLKSTDAGRTWNRVESFPPGDSGGIACVDSERCVAAVHPPLGIDAPWEMWRTIDGGATWQKDDLPLSSRLLNLRGCFSGRCFVEISDFASSANLVTQDLGQTWTSVARPGGDLGPMGCAGPTCVRLQGVYRATLSVSDDWSASWSDSVEPLDAYRFRRIDCPSPDTCFAVGTGGSRLGTTVVRLTIVPRPIVSLVPARLLETRSGPGMLTVDHLYEGGGMVPPGSVVELPVAGRGGVAGDAGSVVLNLTVTQPLAAGFVTVFPCGASRPNASTVNYLAGSTVANSVISKVGVDGKVCLFTLAATHLIVDVGVYVASGLDSVTGVVPARLLETRSGLGMLTVDHLYEGGGVVPAGSVVELPVTGRGGVAGDAGSVVLNVTVTQPLAAGFVTVFPCGVARPLASNLNYSPGSTVANSVISKVGVDGKVCLFTSATSHLIVDVNGYVPPSVSTLSSVVPSRVLETRSGPGLLTVDHLFEGGGPVPGGSVVELPVNGRGGVAADAGTVMLNVTATEAKAAGYITVFPCGGPRPLASNVNYLAGSTVANSVIVKTGDGGKVCLFSLATTHLIVDVNGYAA
jgi:photosystem II stability/assembly factor-like uncharacterized protein